MLKTAGSFPTRPPQTQRLAYARGRYRLAPTAPALENFKARPRAQLAFCAGASAARFFSICRFNSSARGERSDALAFIRNASSPPLWSTVLIALVETRSRTFRPSASEMKVTLHRFGRKRRLVLMLEWLTLWPVRGPLAVSSPRRDISKILFQPRQPFGASGGSKLGSI